MRIFMVLHSSGNFSVPGSMTWYRNLYEPLIELGHDVYLVRMEELAERWKVKFRTGEFKNRLSEYLPGLFAREHAIKPFDLFFSYLTDLDIELAALQLVKKHGVPMANFSCNNTHQFHLVKKTAPLFDFNLHSEKDASMKFESIGATPVWFQMAANPKYYFPVETPKMYDITFVGSNYARRGYYMLFLLKYEMKVHAFGPNWLVNKPWPGLKHIYKELLRTGKLAGSLFTFDPVKRYRMSSSLQHYDIQYLLRKRYGQYLHYPVEDERLNLTYNQGTINLGFLEVSEDPGQPGGFTTTHLHLREFEIPMSGGLHLTNYSDELAEHYIPDEEVLVFRSEYELLDKCRYYLRYPEGAEKIRLAGYSRAMVSHTYQKRYGDLFKELKLPK